MSAERQREPDTSVWVESLVSHRTGEPLVQIAWYDHTGQLDVASARQLAFQLLEAADAAISDAFLVKFLRERDLPDEAAGVLLNEFRQYRIAQEKQDEPERD